MPLQQSLAKLQEKPSLAQPHRPLSLQTLVQQISPTPQGRPSGTHCGTLLQAPKVGSQ